MPSLIWRTHTVAILAGTMLLPGVAIAQGKVGGAGDGPEPGVRAPIATVTPMTRPQSLEELAGMSWPDLERLYRECGTGTIPVGYARGRAIYCPDAPLAATRSCISHLLWHGKHFSADDCTLVNQWCGFKAIRAAVSYGPSWLDGSPSVVMDYGGTSRVWADVRDEVREVAPGLYLGAMYLRREPAPKFKMFFALDCRP